MTNLRSPTCAKRVAHFAQDVWSVFSPLAIKFNAVNLGQGFPNFPCTDFVKEAAAASVESGSYNQYAHPKGLLPLRETLSTTFSPLFHRTLDPEKNILVTSGANMGIFSTLGAYLNPGDECILMEPFFDQYEANVTLVHGVPVFVPLTPKTNGLDGNDWTLDMDLLKSKITNRTKVIIVNTPHNPIGKVFTKKELLDIGQLAIEHNLLILSDEVYERMVYAPLEHVRIATLSEDLWKRTLTIGSAGKTFSVTGWRVGWVLGDEMLVKNVLNAHTRIAFCANAPLQMAVSKALVQAEKHHYYETLTKEYETRARILMKGLEDLGIPYVKPNGGYFIFADLSAVKVPEHYWLDHEVAGLPDLKDWKMCYWLTKEIGVAAIPPSAFYSQPHQSLAANYARLCFCKTEETLHEAVRRLQKLKLYFKQ
ncbi:hypothetical protein HMI54_014535 [Coelomomyces lativittatus]|nr:hypothetical protein HMI56_006668 [Coelomomyces lativittatus]KAJ1514039.1 hypothetical protein HMI54_014535 [Coelomomyces lativittatus]KAJ1517720.1 hypothetical protein HMI55_006217 [Coelomomyces lativittatus]